MASLGETTVDTDNVTSGELGSIVLNDGFNERNIPLPDDWEAIAHFALTFDGYRYWGSFDKCATVANSAVKRYASKGLMPTSLTDLRTCLFFEQRRWRHTGELPTAEHEKLYIYALLEAIRRCRLIPSFEAIAADVRTPLIEAARRWKEAGAEQRPRVQPDVLAHWDGLIAAWVEDVRMPLLIRKSACSGQMLEHSSGRAILCVDNSPANWCLSSALLERRPTPQDLLAALDDGTLPIAMIKPVVPSSYKGTMRRMGDVPNLNTLGWKVCHVYPAGMKERLTPTVSIAKLKERSRRLLTPRNMFVVPNDEYAALGELPEFIAAFKDPSCTTGD
jgi:hypothetical protein